MAIVLHVQTTNGIHLACPQDTQFPLIHGGFPFAMERYLNEAPNDSGPIYGLAHRQHRKLGIMNALARFDAQERVKEET